MKKQYTFTEAEYFYIVNQLERLSISIEDIYEGLDERTKEELLEPLKCLNKQVGEIASELKES